jgi:hypothetical protein
MLVEVWFYLFVVCFEWFSDRTPDSMWIQLTSNVYFTHVNSDLFRDRVKELNLDDFVTVVKQALYDVKDQRFKQPLNLTSTQQEFKEEAKDNPDPEPVPEVDTTDPEADTADPDADTADPDTDVEVDTKNADTSDSDNDNESDHQPASTSHKPETKSKSEGE